jgi:hypothetical protein
MSDIATPRELLPDKKAFVAIKKAVLQSVLFNTSMSFILGAAQGTSGTTTGHEWCDDIFKGTRSNVHYGRTTPKSNGTSPSEEFVRSIGTSLANRRPGHKHTSAPPPSITSSEFQTEHAEILTKYFGALLKLSPPLGCLADTPWVNYFSELFYATCPQVKVFLFTRDSVDWATSRIAHHGGSKAGFICPVHEQIQYNPFSILECGHSPGMRADKRKKQGEGEALNNEHMSITQMATAYRKYNRLVRNIVPSKMLLELKIFQANYYSYTMNAIQWSNSNFALLKQFLNEHNASASARSAIKTGV